MYRTIGLFLGLTLCLTLTAQAHGHFLFIALVATPDGKHVADVYFSDSAEAGDPQFIDKIAGTKIWLQEQPGKFEPLQTNKLKDRLTAAVPDKGTFIVVGKCEYGVLAKKTPFLLRHFPKAITGAPAELAKLKTYAGVPLEIVSQPDNGRLRLTVLRQGKPMPHAEIYTLAKDLSGTKLKCDAAGSLSWQPPKTGWYMVYTSDFKKESGTFQGKEYQEIRDFASLSFYWPEAGGKSP
jgi:uncharacterized GH25 family protein